MQDYFTAMHRRPRRPMNVLGLTWSEGHLMRRREFIKSISSTAIAWPLAARAQQSMPVVGVLSPQSAATAARNLSALRNGLRELGYTEGQNVQIEYRFAEGGSERYAALLANLVALKPAVIVVGSTGAIMAAIKVTRTIPLIMFAVADNPVALGLVESFARPGGNVTGFLLASDASILGKRLELLREAAPGFSRVGIMAVPDDAGADGTLKALPSAAAALRLDTHVYEVRSKAELEPAFAAARRDGVQALYMSQSPFFLAHRAEVVALVASMRLPAIYFFREFTQAGGLMSYGADLPDAYRRATTYVDKILKGDKPGDLPLQSADKFELVVNLKAAKALGLAISEAFLLRADEVIE
jgi:putative ABC transport system substrate-binding protein